MAIKDKDTGYGSTNGSATFPNSSSLPSEAECNGESGMHEDIINDLKSSYLRTDTDDHNGRVLSNVQRFSYGVGHVLNDLTASMWFSYLLIFLQKVDLFSNFLAGNLMLIGQVSDALFTPFIGYESDRTKGLLKLGTFCVMATFVFLFSECITCSNSPNIAQFVYYTPFVVIFQFGWAATQISHLSFSSDITPYKHERVTLQSIRNSFTVISNLSVYGLLTLLFYLGDSEGGSDKDNITHADAAKFRNLAIISIGIGTVFNCIFYLGTKNCDPHESTAQSSSGPPGENSIEKSSFVHSLMSWRCWLKQLQFYQVALLYMSTRLYINISQVYFPMYLTETIDLAKESGAFVFGAMSFTDKLSNGLAVVIIQFFHPCKNCCPACKGYYRIIQTFVPGGALLCGFIMLLTLLPQKIGVRDTRANERLPSTPQPALCSLNGEDNDSDIVPCGFQSGCAHSTPVPPACDAVTHCVEVYSHFDQDNNKGELKFITENINRTHLEDEAEGERRHLLGSVNTQVSDLGRIS
ncbi:major facilitator superfamily domain-containing protein 12 [Plakobranchus ocellatus]|uniref:Major facilitator superfamily domain-containing protein 12 n=1 Tax=Plakobranchus ocellatus TaxID=259542 RepID=A0AAV3YCE4_9GAST|nr:major facilitator superfamily domain-containing protein 12 [Plakobranchus ocellatus]